MTDVCNIFTLSPEDALKDMLGPIDYSSLCVITDTNAGAFCLPCLPSLKDCPTIRIPAGESHKNIETLTDVWHQLLAGGFKRNGLIVNVGGGVVCDLGGFAAATWMRGVRYVNIPTTLLAMVDASSGGKTAIDFEGVKNLVGAFHMPLATIVSPVWLATLPKEELLSGWAEMLKHAVLDSGEHLEQLLQLNPNGLSDGQMLELIERSCGVKQRIVMQDPEEEGLRRSLNLGHTFGHALEALQLSKGSPISHGHAVALGMLTELSLSRAFPRDPMERLVDHVLSLYEYISISDDDGHKLSQMMRNDKKNRDGMADRADYIAMEAPGICDLYASASPSDFIEAYKRINGASAPRN